MLNHQEYCFLKRLAAHEVGHSICGLTVGKILGRVRIFKDAAGHITGGQSDFGFGETPKDAAAAWREAVSLYGGHVGERLLCRAETIEAAGATYIGPGSDQIQLIHLANQWGGEDPVAWSLAAETRAEEILKFYGKQHRECYRRIVENFEYIVNYELDWLSGPLATIRFNAKFAETPILPSSVLTTTTESP